MNKARLGILGTYHSFMSSRLNGMIFASNCYGYYCIPADAKDRPAARYVIAGRIWERETIECMLDHARLADVITAGAFFGDALPALSSVAPPDGIVWAFEPNPENFRCSSTTILLNDLKNVRLANAGLGAETGTSQLITCDFTGRVSLIQLDIEGFEEFAILGAAKTITRCKPRLILETVPETGSAAMALLSNLNYSIVRRLDSENFLLAC